MREFATHDEALAAEARRVHDRYVVELVEALKVCPWAERARLEGRTRQIVIAGAEPSMDAALAGAAELSADARIEVGFLIFPSLEQGRVEFERFVAALRRSDAARAGESGPAMAMAAFHYDAPVDLGSPHRLIPFLRRSPDPTVQLVRRSVLDALRGPGDHGTAFVDPATTDLRAFLTMKKKPPLHERVAQMNLETTLAVGVERLEALLAEIKRDRDASYARIRERFG